VDGLLELVGGGGGLDAGEAFVGEFDVAAGVFAEEFALVEGDGVDVGVVGDDFEAGDFDHLEDGVGGRAEAVG